MLEWSLKNIKYFSTTKILHDEMSEAQSSTASSSALSEGDASDNELDQSGYHSADSISDSAYESDGEYMEEESDYSDDDNFPEQSDSSGCFSDVEDMA